MFNRLRNILCLLLLLPAAGSAQDDQARARVLHDSAEAAVARGTSESLQQALVLYRQAIDIYTELDDAAGFFDAAWSMGDLFRAFGQLDSAVVYHEYVVQMAREHGEPVLLSEALTAYYRDLWYRAEANAANKERGAALAGYRQAYDVVEELRRNHVPPVSAGIDSALLNIMGSRLMTLERIGRMHLESERHDSALFYYRVVMREAPKDSGTIFYGSYGAGSAFAGLSRPDSALVYFRRALAHMAASNEPETNAELMRRVGVVYARLGREDSAAVYLSRAQTTAAAIGATGIQAAIASEQAIADPDALDLDQVRAAVVAARATGDAALLHNALGNLAWAYLMRGEQTDSAVLWLRQVVDWAAQNGRREMEAMALLSLATQLPLSDALAATRRATLLARSTSDDFTEARALGTTGYLYHAAGLPGLRTAIAYYDSAGVVLRRIYQHAGSDQNVIATRELDTHIYEQAALAWLALAGDEGERNAAFLALAAVEDGRAQALLSLIGASNREAVDRLLRERGAQQYGSTISLGSTPSLYYMVTSDTLVVWGIDPRGAVAVTRVGITRDSLAVLVTELRRALQVDGITRDSGGPVVRMYSPARRDMSGQLTTILLDILIPEPVRKLTMHTPGTELLIVPHGVLFELPFAALTFKDGVPLGIRYALRYAPSLSTLRTISARPARRSVAAALVAGNPSYAAFGDRFRPLPGAQLEAVHVAQQLGQDALLGAAATESAVRAQLATADVVHLATHGVVFSEPERVRDSFVLLARDAVQDGMLTIGEVLDELPQLSAELVVLSACQTGLGDRRSAEGTVGLQRAFLARGARSVLVSLWSVDDAATRLLMESFYEAWTGGASKTEALRMAQEKLRTNEKYRMPRYWAAFQLVGAD